MKGGLFAALLCLGLTLAAAPNPEKIADVKAGKTDTAYASWWGFREEDSAEILQAAAREAGAKAK